MRLAETERLALLAEECGEVIQIIGKILRHGYESYHPSDEFKNLNRKLLQKEIGHVKNAVNMMVKADDVDKDSIQGHCDLKSGDILKYLNHQG